MYFKEPAVLSFNLFSKRKVSTNLCDTASDNIYCYVPELNILVKEFYFQSLFCVFTSLCSKIRIFIQM